MDAPAAQTSVGAGFRVTFVSGGARALVEGDGTILDLARRAGLTLPSLCGGRGKCVKCRCRPQGPCDDPSPLELELLDPGELARGIRLGCQARPRGDVTLEIEEEILDKADYIEVAITPDPSVRQVVLSLPRPTLHDDLADVERLRNALGHPVSIELDLLRRLPGLLRAGEFRVTATLCERGGADELLALEPGDRRDQAYGIAFDLGTTTVAGYLVDLLTGKEVARSARLNGQQPWGADVLSRASHAMEQPDGALALQAAAAGTLNQIIEDCCGSVDRSQIYAATVVGNAIMHHLALGVSPASIAVSPYVAAVRDGLSFRAAEVGLNLPNARVDFLPLIGAYVGSDMLGVLLATGLDESPDVQLAVDIGTNGEMALGSRERLLACSAPAGPAFEGGAIRGGMRATAGAIDRVRIADDVRIWTIGDAPPRGICGSGLIDALAQMVKRGIVDPGGRLLPRPRLEGRLPAQVLDRIVGQGPTWEFVLSRDPYVAVTQQDVRQLQLAKGTILCGIRILMEELGARPGEIRRVLLAGAFGNFIDKRSALGIAMFPPEIPAERIQSVGNAAGQGSRMSLLSRTVRARAEALARRVEYLELSKHPRFEEIFIESMRLAD
jgi:uncharacterized 2Fe-2S/4Fe-4S cluster protein (DUF4445 family)